MHNTERIFIVVYIALKANDVNYFFYLKFFQKQTCSVSVIQPCVTVNTTGKKLQVLLIAVRQCDITPTEELQTAMTLHYITVSSQSDCL